MAQFLIIPFLEELGVAAGVSEVATTVTGSEALGTLAGGVVQGEAANIIAQPINKAGSSYYEQNIAPTVKTGSVLGSALFSNDPQSVLIKKQQPTTFVSPVPPHIGNENSKNYFSTSDNNKRKTNYDPFKKIVDEGQAPDPIIKYVDRPYIPKYDRFDRQDQSPRDVARYVINISKKLAKHKDLRNAQIEELELNPQELSLTQKITNFFKNKSLPNTDEFKRIYQVYNMNGVTGSSFSKAVNPRTGLIEITGIDETGRTFTLPQTTGLILPSVSGTVFMGARSRNDDVPNPERVEDMASFFHDVSYTNGINRLGDLTYIARLDNCLKNGRVKPENRNLVNSTIIYFSNISLNLSMFFPQEPAQNDIFEYLNDDLDPTNEEYDGMRKEFTDILEEELRTYNTTDGLLATWNNDIISDEINNILSSIEISLS